jgi:quercetin dioxygenase-like cupin family protein
MEPNVTFHGADGVMVMQWVFEHKGSLVPQHEHAYDHLSMLASGSIRVAVDGKFLGVYHAPAGINIQAGKKHVFLTLEDNTVIYCIHNVMRSGEVDITDEHVLDFGG